MYIMRICLIGPSGATIPPNGWGAVESLMWDYFVVLKKQHAHSVIYLTCPENEMVQACNMYVPDIVYIMYDDYAYMSEKIACKKVYFMSHYAYITSPQLTDTYKWYYENIFMQAIRYQQYLTLNALSKDIADVYRKHGFKGRINIIGNGADDKSFQYTTMPTRGTQSIYVGKVEFRKRQYVYQNVPNLMFAGNYQDSDFDRSNPNYLGEWTKHVLYENLTNYGNLVLLSDGEADPLVVKEALIAGLGVVVSECASANLDRSKPFISIIPNDKLTDINYVSAAIASNRKISLSMREDIRKYALETFSWSVIVKRFLDVAYADA